MSETLQNDVLERLRDIPDFPKPGILFKDIMPVLSDGALFSRVIDHFVERYSDRGITQIVAIESRGFLFGSALAHRLQIGLVPVRKPGKLPYETASVEYALEYGTDVLEIHTDALTEGDRVVVIDDLLATGGTAAATVSLVSQLGAEILETAFLVELAFLPGREKLGNTSVYSVVSIG